MDDWIYKQFTLRKKQILTFGQKRHGYVVEAQQYHTDKLVKRTCEVASAKDQVRQHYIYLPSPLH